MAFDRKAALAAILGTTPQAMEQAEIENQIKREAILRESLVRDAYTVQQQLTAQDVDAARNTLQRRVERLRAMQADPSDTVGLLQRLDAGDITGALRDVSIIVDYANRFGIGRNNGDTADIQTLREQWRLYEDPNTPDYIKEAIDVSWGRRARQGMPKLTTVGDVPYTWTPGGTGLDAVIAPTGQPVTAETVGGNKAVVSGRTKAAEAAVKAGEQFFEQLRGVTRSIANISNAVNALDRGANTGVIAEKFPSITEASVELDNIRNQMGLDIIGATTFGALSESELQFALDTAIPTSLNEKALKNWLLRKKEAQKKLQHELGRAARFLIKHPESGISGYLEMLEAEGELILGADEYERWKAANQ